MTARTAEIDEDLRQERLEWRAQRAGWGFLLLLVLAAVVGLSGPGPFSRDEAVAGDLHLQHERIVHRAAPTELEIVIEPGERAETELELAGSWLAAHRLERVMPEPVRALSAPDRLALAFARRPGEALRVQLLVEPRRIGRCEGRLAADGGPSLAFGVTVLP